MTDKYRLTVDGFLGSLPEVLQMDANCYALAQSIGGTLVKLVEDAEEINIYGSIDTLPEALLDALAIDLKIDWWREGASLEEKRDLIKTCWYVHRHLGTKAAIETAVKSFLGEGKCEEWFEYDGQPHHFRIIGATNAAVNEHYEEFMRLLAVVQRGSSVLDNVTALIKIRQQLYVGMALRLKTTGEIPCNDVDDALIEILTDENVTVLTDENGNILMDENGNVLYE